MGECSYHPFRMNVIEHDLFTNYSELFPSVQLLHINQPSRFIYMMTIPLSLHTLNLVSFSQFIQPPRLFIIPITQSIHICLYQSSLRFSLNRYSLQHFLDFDIICFSLLQCINQLFGKDQKIFIFDFFGLLYCCLNG